MNKVPFLVRLAPMFVKSYRTYRSKMDAIEASHFFERAICVANMLDRFVRKFTFVVFFFFSACSVQFLFCMIFGGGEPTYMTRIKTKFYATTMGRMIIPAGRRAVNHFTKHAVAITTFAVNSGADFWVTYGALGEGPDQAFV